jgi:hypothetical protein
MPAEQVLSETVVFELQDRNGAGGLWERLRPRWFGGLYESDDGNIVSVELRSEEGDFASLLRTVQFWAHESGLDTLQFHVDGRAYVLEAKTAIWPAAAA